MSTQFSKAKVALLRIIWRNEQIHEEKFLDLTHLEQRIKILQCVTLGKSKFSSNQCI